MKIEYSKEAKEFMRTLSPKERKEIKKELAKLSENPYRGTPMWGGWGTQLRNKLMFIKTEITRRF
jgi:mRNA-degrading endonuclease RelE of RelBE toxin-antitoxin system